MPDMLVKLYALPTVDPLLANLDKTGIEIRRGRLSEKHTIADWVRKHFEDAWAVGCEKGLDRRPISCYVAVERSEQTKSRKASHLPLETIMGFACYDVAGKGIFGPIGVREDYRKHGIGKTLLLACLHAMVTDGYSYAVIGSVGPAEFYTKTVNATLITG